MPSDAPRVPPSALVMDTGVVVAAANRRDAQHAACARLVLSAPGPLLIPEPLLAEIAFLLGTRGSAEVEAQFIEDTVNGAYEVVSLTEDDRRRVAELVRAYGDLPLGTADASVAAVAERFQLHQVATIDRRDFSILRPAHVSAFTLLP